MTQPKRIKKYTVTYAKSNARDAQRYKTIVNASSKQAAKDIILYERKIITAQVFKFE